MSGRAGGLGGAVVERVHVGAPGGDHQQALGRVQRVGVAGPVGRPGGRHLRVGGVGVDGGVHHAVLGPQRQSCLAGSAPPGGERVLVDIALLAAVVVQFGALHPVVQPREHAAGADRAKLERIPDAHDLGAVPGGLGDQDGHVAVADHGGFVHDQHVHARKARAGGDALAPGGDRAGGDARFGAQAGGGHRGDGRTFDPQPGRLPGASGRRHDRGLPSPGDSEDRVERVSALDQAHHRTELFAGELEAFDLLPGLQRPQGRGPLHHRRATVLACLGGVQNDRLGPGQVGGGVAGAVGHVRGAHVRQPQRHGVGEHVGGERLQLRPGGDTPGHAAATAAITRARLTTLRCAVTPVSGSHTAAATASGSGPRSGRGPLGVGSSEPGSRPVRAARHSTSGG